MLISKVNRVCERHGRLVLIIMALVIVVPFVFFWGPGSSAFRSQGGVPEDVGEMFGEPIPTDAFLFQVRAVELNTLLRSGRWVGQEPRFRSMIQEQAVRRLRLLHEAEERGIEAVSQGEVEATIKRMFAGEDGTFDADLYRNVSRNVLPRLGMNEAQFMNIVRDNIITDRLNSIAADTVRVSPLEVTHEVKRQYETFRVTQAVFRRSEYRSEAKLEPTQEEMQAYFAEHRGKLSLPDQKRVRVARVRLAEIEKGIDVSETKIAAYFEEHKEKYEEDGRELADVRGEIEGLLKNTEARAQALQKINNVVDEMKDVMSENAEIAPAEALKSAAEGAGVDTVDSGPFTPDMPIPNLGFLPLLRKRAYALTEADYLSEPVLERGQYYVACWLETIEGGVPEALNAAVERIIRRNVVDTKIEAFYTEHIAPFKTFVAAGLSPEEITSRFAEGTLNMEDFPGGAELDEAAFSDLVTTYLSPYYEPPQKKARVVTFQPAAFRDRIDPEIAEEEMRDYYNTHEDKYGEQVKVRHILLRIPRGADEAAKAEVKARLQAIRERIVSGEASFADMARQESESPAAQRNAGSLGFIKRGQMVPAFETAAFGLQKGEISSPVETRYGFHLLKVEDRKPEKEFAEVSAKIREEIKKQRARNLAAEVAANFAYKAFEAVDEAGESGLPPAEIFEDVAEKNAYRLRDSDWFRKNRPAAPFQSVAAVNKAYNLTQRQPVSEMIEGNDRYHVACFLDRKPGELPALEGNRQLRMQIKRQMEREKALTTAREKAEEAYRKIKENLDGGMTFAKAADQYEFEDVPEFTNANPPRRAPNGSIVANVATQHAAGTLIKPRDIREGATLIYVAARELPTDEEIEEHRDEVREQLLQRKRSAAIRNFHDRLAVDSNTALAEDVIEQLM